jgi:hypothetical protein
MDPPNVLSNMNFCIDYDLPTKSYLIIKEATEEPSWQTLLLTGKSLSTREISTWEIQILNTTNLQCMHVGIIYGEEFPKNWIPVTTNTWLAEIESEAFNGVSFDPVDISTGYRVFANTKTFPNHSRPMSKDLPMPLQPGNSVRFIYNPFDGTIWISLSIDCYLRQYLFASGLFSKKVIPAVSLLYPNDSITYFPLDIHLE